MEASKMICKECHQNDCVDCPKDRPDGSNSGIIPQDKNR